MDGNKRVAALIMLSFLELNDIKLFFEQMELYEIINGVASGSKTQNDLIDWIITHK